MMPMSQVKYGPDIDAAYNVLIASGRVVLDESVHERAMLAQAAEYKKQFGEDHRRELKNMYAAGYRAGVKAGVAQTIISAIKNKKGKGLWETLKRRASECFNGS
jgi:flagellar biosynthesis/type III secretory pathway protein FliH